MKALEDQSTKNVVERGLQDGIKFRRILQKSRWKTIMDLIKS